jgi:hypothetical protein
MEGSLLSAVDGFVADLAPELQRIAGRLDGVDASHATDDVVIEAFDVAAAFIDVDGTHDEAELWELIRAFGPRLRSMLGLARPAEVRTAGVLAGRSRFLEAPSSLFEILRADDARTGGRTTWRYYERAMAIAHAIADLDPNPVVDKALDHFRRMLADDMVGKAAVPATEVSRPVDPAAEPRTVDEVLADLDELVGLEPVKAEVKLVTNLLRVQKLRRERNLPVPGRSQHLVFTGNPGTGKTTVARLLAEIYRALGVVSKGQLVETDRSGLVAGYVGQTAPLVTKVVTSALGGVLLIDEAYGLSRAGDAFGQEAIDTLVKLMEDHRGDLVVVVAGYPEEMTGFVAANPGLASRFPRTVDFPDYDDDELVAIFGQLCSSNSYRLGDGTEQRLREVLVGQPRGRGFGNGRVARNIFEAAVERQASRVVAVAAPSDEDLCTLVPGDLVDPES